MSFAARDMCDLQVTKATKEEEDDDEAGSKASDAGSESEFVTLPHSTMLGPYFDTLRTLVQVEKRFR